jgi:hypothetical protein
MLLAEIEKAMFLGATSLSIQRRGNHLVHMMIDTGMHPKGEKPRPPKGKGCQQIVESVKRMQLRGKLTAQQCYQHETLVFKSGTEKVTLLCTLTLCMLILSARQMNMMTNPFHLERTQAAK